MPTSYLSATLRELADTATDALLLLDHEDTRKQTLCLTLRNAVTLEFMAAQLGLPVETLAAHLMTAAIKDADSFLEKRADLSAFGSADEEINSYLAALEVLTASQKRLNAIQLNWRSLFDESRPLPKNSGYHAKDNEADKHNEDDEEEGQAPPE